MPFLLHTLAMVCHCLYLPFSSSILNFFLVNDSLNNVLEKNVQTKEKVIDELQQEMSKLNKEAESKIQSLEAENNELLLGKVCQHYIIVYSQLKDLLHELLYHICQKSFLLNILHH